MFRFAPTCSGPDFASWYVAVTQILLFRGHISVYFCHMTMYNNRAIPYSGHSFLIILRFFYLPKTFLIQFRLTLMLSMEEKEVLFMFIDEDYVQDETFISIEPVPKEFFEAEENLAMHNA